MQLDRDRNIVKVDRGESNITHGSSADSLQSTSEILQGHLTFGHTERLHLHRGIRLSRVVRRGAALLSTGRGSLATYALSTPVNQNDYFLSHNWSVSRWRKYLSLILHFNERSAICAAFLAAALCFSLEAAGVIPLPYAGFAWCKDASCNTDTPKAGICVRLVTAPVFVLVLFFKYDVLPLDVSPGPLLFLDKTCIHQVDAELQKKGIAKLGAFLKHSRRMLIIYSDVYLRKLWTVYEIACFLATSRDDCQGMEIVHISMTPYFLLALAIMYLNAILPLSSEAFIQYFIYLSLAVAGTVVFRYGHRERVSAWRRAKNFAVEDAMCFDESDRPRVESIIVALMTSQQYVAEHALREDALKVFNEVVRVHVLRTMQVTLGTLPFSTKHAVVAWCLTVLSKNLDRLAFDLKEGAYDEFCLYLASCITMMLGHAPLCFALMRWMTGKNGWKDWMTDEVDALEQISLTGWKEWLYVTFCAFVGLCTVCVLFIIDGVLLSSSKTSFSHLLAYMVYDSASLMASAALYRRRRLDLKSKLKEEAIRKETDRARWFAKSISSFGSSEGQVSIDSDDQPTTPHLKSGNLWKLNHDVDGCQTSFRSWRCRYFTATQNTNTISVQHLSEKGNGSVIETVVFSSLTGRAHAGLMEMAPVTMDSLDPSDQLLTSVNMQEYQLIIGKPIHRAAEDYCADIPRVLYPLCISGKDSSNEMQSVVLAASSAQEQQMWLSIFRKAMAIDCGAMEQQMEWV